GRAGIDRIWSATNLSQQTSVCTQHITFVDSTLPTITCPSNRTANANAGQCFATGVALGAPITSDNCGVASVTSNVPAQILVGTTNVIWAVTDGCGNSASCTQMVTVVDNQPPTISCPANIVTNAAAGSCTISNLNLGTPLTADNCAVATVVNDAASVFSVGTTPVHWIATDVHGNSATCTQTVTVVANAAACSITGPVSVCVSTTTNYAGPAGLTAYGWSITGNGAISGATNTQSVAVQATTAGSFTLSLTVTDTNQCSSSACQLTVTVIDAGAPLLSCPSDRQLQCGESTST